MENEKVFRNYDEALDYWKYLRLYNEGRRVYMYEFFDFDGRFYAVGLHTVEEM